MQQLTNNLQSGIFGNAFVYFKDGSQIAIKNVVKKKLEGEIRTLNEQTGRIEFKRIIDWHELGTIKNNSDLLNVKAEGLGRKDGTKNGITSITLTPSHKLLTEQGWIEASKLFNFQLQIACPAGYNPDAMILQFAGKNAKLCASPEAAVQGAHLVSTDVWSSMGQEDEQSHRLSIFKPYQVNTPLMSLAEKDALFMHCLPAHRGEEVSTDVIDGAQSVVWDEAENRLHIQKALLEFLLS